MDTGVSRFVRATGVGRRPRSMLCLVVLATVTASACAELGGRRRMSARDQAVITTQELTALNVNNAYDAVLQPRPTWLSSSGRRSSRLPTEIVVAQNSSYFGPLSSLRTFQIESVKEMRYLDSSQAGAFLSGLGSRHVEGAIVVVLR
jgi:hypothetical protein